MPSLSRVFSYDIVLKYPADLLIHFLPQVWLIASSLADILIAVAMVLLVSDQIH
jgi:hypothetical protein